MHAIERLIYNRIRFHPRLKKSVTTIYQSLFSLVPGPKIDSSFPVQIREGYFFGFHDKCPWSLDNSKLLAHKFDNACSFPEEGDKIIIGYFNGDSSAEYVPLAQTPTWNWQMGSMLQWVGETGKILYNDYDGERHVARIITCNGELVATLPRPVAALSIDGTHAISHSFIRLRKVARAYSYPIGAEEKADLPITDKDGLYLINLVTGTVKELFSLVKIAAIHPEDSMRKAYHYFTHPLFAPNGERFVFFHRWVTPAGQTWTRMFSSDISGEKLHLFKTAGVVTHTAWKDNQRILAYALIKGIGDHYYLFTDLTDRFEIIGKDYFTSDGHPQFAPDKKRFVTDTYPDRHRRQRLIIYDTENKIPQLLLNARSPLRYRGDVRCDFHPRWDRKGNQVAFDSAHTGTRALCTVSLPDLK